MDWSAYLEAYARFHIKSQALQTVASTRSAEHRDFFDMLEKASYAVQRVLSCIVVPRRSAMNSRSP